jgi:FdhD protein
MVERAGNSDQSPGPVDALPEAIVTAAATVWRADGASHFSRSLPEETAVALVHDGSTEAVMMATPADLEDFAVGFSLSEGIIRDLAEIRSLEIVAQPEGIEARLWLAAERGQEAASRRRTRAGPTGCGLCGVDSLAEAARLRIPSVLPQLAPVTPAQLLAAMAELDAAQVLGPQTRAVHAAGFWRPDDGLVAVREDVGRHNALDKLVGALARAGDPNRAGAVLLTSRVSVEMVQKTAALGAPLLVAVSAPTALAVRTAERAGITLVAVARRDGFEVFTHPHRIAL